MRHGTRWFARKIWDLRRFGLTPAKLWARLSNRSEPRILLVSVPKAGTHLVERALCLHPKLYRKFLPTLHSENIGKYGGLGNLLDSMEPGQIIVSHLHYSPKYLRLIQQRHIHTIFVIRDPRDIVVSRAHYIAKNKSNPYHNFFREKSLSERIHLAIQGEPKEGLLGIAEILDRFAGWMNESDCTVHFEKMIIDTHRWDMLSSIFDTLNITFNRSLQNHINKSLISPASPTFRKGSTGEWEHVYDEETRRMFNASVNEDLMDWYGYESCCSSHAQD